MRLLMFPIKWCLGWLLMVVAIVYWGMYLFLPLWILIALGFWIGVLPSGGNGDEFVGWILTMICMGLSSWFMTTHFPTPVPKKLGDWFSSMNKWIDF